MKYVDSVKYISTQCLKTPVISSIFILPYFIRLKFNSEFDSMLKFYSNQLLWQHHSDQFWFKVPMGWEAGCSLHSIMALKLTEDKKRWEWWILKLAPTTTQITLELFFENAFLLLNSIWVTIRKLHGVCFFFLIFDLFDCKKNHCHHMSNQSAIDIYVWLKNLLKKQWTCSVTLLFISYHHCPFIVTTIDSTRWHKAMRESNLDGFLIKQLNPHLYL